MYDPRKRLHSRVFTASPNPSWRLHSAWFLIGVCALGVGCGADASSSIEPLRPLASAPALQARSLSKKLSQARREQDDAATAATAEPPSQNAVAEIHRFVGRGGLLASDRADNDQFGWSVAVSGDSTTAVVGAISGSDATGGTTTGNGAAYIFVRTLYVWSQQAKLIALDKADFDSLGSSVALSRDGNTALVGALAKEDAGSGTVQSGAAYLFVRTGTTWTQQAKLVAKDAQDYDHFGSAVALSADGNTALISSTWAGDATRATIRNGAVYVFKRSLAGWNQEAKLVAKDRATDDFFGISVSLSETGDTALIGAYQTDDTAASTTNNGSAYLFERSISGWVEGTRLTATDKASGAYFGSAVSLSDSGNVALIGAFGSLRCPVDPQRRGLHLRTLGRGLHPAGQAPGSGSPGRGRLRHHGFAVARRPVGVYRRTLSLRDGHRDRRGLYVRAALGTGMAAAHGAGASRDDRLRTLWRSRGPVWRRPPSACRGSLRDRR